MLYLSGVSRPELRDALPAVDLGLLWTPASYRDKQHVDGAAWAADNGCFSDSFDVDKWRAWLTWMSATEHAEQCLFAVAPDVVGDAAATAKRSRPFLAEIRALGYPVAYVLQDGQEDVPLPWDEIDAVFIGGSTEFKLGSVAAACVYEAKARGLWAHMGRVNSLKRLMRAAVMGCDSADGTYLRWGAPGENMARMVGWVRNLANAPVLPVGDDLAAVAR